MYLYKTIAHEFTREARTYGLWSASMSSRASTHGSWRLVRRRQPWGCCGGTGDNGTRAPPGTEIMNLMLPKGLLNGGLDVGLGPVPVAFVGRTSDAEVQDPTLSIPRQLAAVRAKLPAGWTIVAYYWDIESGGLPLDERGLGHAPDKF